MEHGRQSRDFTVLEYRVGSAEYTVKSVAFSMQGFCYTLFDQSRLNFPGFVGVPEGREEFRKVSRGGTLHSDRIWPHTEPYGPKSSRYL